VKEKFLTLLLIIFISINVGEAQIKSSNFNNDISDSEKEWVNNLYDNMTLDERIGQLFSIRAHSDLGR